MPVRIDPSSSTGVVVRFSSSRQVGTSAFRLDCLKKTFKYMFDLLCVFVMLRVVLCNAIASFIMERFHGSYVQYMQALFKVICEYYHYRVLNPNSK